MKKTLLPFGSFAPKFLRIIWLKQYVRSKQFLTIFYFFFLVVGYGQNAVESNSNWQVGLDLLPFIDTSYSLRHSVLIRNSTSDKSKLRCRIGAFIEHVSNKSNPDDTPIIDEISRDVFKGYFSLGHEWYLSENSIAVYLGADVFILYEKRIVTDEYDNRPYAIPPTVRHEIDSYRSARMGLKGLVGANIRIIKNLFISPETFLEVAYRWERGKYELFQRENMELTVYGGRTIKRIIIDVQPVSVINLVYQF